MKILPAIVAVVLGTALVVSVPLAASAALPEISDVPATTVTDDSTPVTPFPATVIADADSSTIDIVVTWDSTKGALAGSGFAAAPGTLTATAVDPATATTALRSLLFTPIPGLTADTLITVAATDDTGTGTATTTVSVTAVTPPPVDIHIVANPTAVYGAGTPPLVPEISNDEDKLTSPPTCDYVGAAPINPAVGSYPTICSGAAAQPGYNIVYDDGALTVTPATATITASDASATYGQPLPTITASYSGLQYGETSVPGTTCASATLAVPSVASNCSGASSANYDITYIPGLVTVSPAPLTITPSNANAVYGSTAAVTPMFAGFVAGESNSVLTTQPTCTTTAGSTAHVGGHPNTTSCTGAVATNYVIGYGASGTTTITPAPLSITALGQSRLAGQPNAPFGVTYSGFVNGESPANLTGTLTFTTQATTSSPPGSYPVQPAGVSSTDYAITFLPGIVKVTQNVTPPSPSPTPTATPTASPTPTPTPTRTPSPSPTSTPIPDAGGPAGSGLEWLPWVLIPAGVLFLAALIGILVWRRRSY